MRCGLTHKTSAGYTCVYERLTNFNMCIFVTKYDQEQRIKTKMMHLTRSWEQKQKSSKFYWAKQCICNVTLQLPAGSSSRLFYCQPALAESPCDREEIINIWKCLIKFVDIGSVHGKTLSYKGRRRCEPSGIETPITVFKLSRTVQETWDCIFL